MTAQAIAQGQADLDAALAAPFAKGLPPMTEEKDWENAIRAAIAAEDLASFRALIHFQVNRSMVWVFPVIAAPAGPEALSPFARTAMALVVEEMARHYEKATSVDFHYVRNGNILATLMRHQDPFLVAHLMERVMLHPSFADHVSPAWASVHRGMQWPSEEVRQQIKVSLAARLPRASMDKLSLLALRRTRPKLVMQELYEEVMEGTPDGLVAMMDRMQPSSRELGELLLALASPTPATTGNGLRHRGPLQAPERRKIREALPRLLAWLSPPDRIDVLCQPERPANSPLCTALDARDFQAFALFKKELLSHPLGQEAWQMLRSEVAHAALSGFVSRSTFSQKMWDQSLAVLGGSPEEEAQWIAKSKVVADALASRHVRPALVAAAIARGGAFVDTPGEPDSLSKFIQAHTSLDAWDAGSPCVQMLEVFLDNGVDLFVRAHGATRSLDRLNLGAPVHDLIKVRLQGAQLARMVPQASGPAARPRM